MTTAPALLAGLDQAPVTLSFDAALVPCEDLHTRWVLSGLRDAAERHSAIEYGQKLAQLVASAPDVSDPDAVHRWLLATRKAAPRAWISRVHVKYALDAVRQHSDLYGARHCLCLSEAWWAFADKVAAALAEIPKLPDVEVAGWRVQRDAAPLRDLIGSCRLTSAALGQTLGIAGTSYDGLRHLRLRSTVKPRLSVTISRTTDGRVSVEATWGPPRRQTQARMVSLTRQERALSEDMAHLPEPRRHDGGSWMATWPTFMIDLAAAWRTNLRYVSLVATAQEFLDAGAGDLLEPGRRVALALAPAWEGSPAELVHTARAIQGAA